MISGLRVLASFRFSLVKFAIVCCLSVTSSLCRNGHSAEPASPAPIHPTVMMFHKWDMEKAPAVVDKAAMMGAKRVQFCITLCSELDKELKPKNFGYLRENRDGSEGNTFYPSDELLREEFKGWLNAAFERALAHKMEVAVMMHLNAHGDIQEWRNFFQFDPLQPINSCSYEQAMVIPVMESLEAVLPSDWPVQVSLQGEMGATVFQNPAAWRELLKRTKQRAKLTNATYGLSFNHGGISGRVVPSESGKNELAGLWQDVDFIGISMYQPVSVPPVPQDFVLSTGKFVGEFEGLGCALPSSTKLQFLEFGVGGGGTSPSGQTEIPASSVTAAAAAPYLGTDKVELNPWRNDELTQLRRQAYAALCESLLTKTSRYPIERVYLWNFGSWDVHGLTSPAFVDQEIADRIKQHNSKCDQ